jgi:AcrR family transcriptional regulator
MSSRTRDLQRAQTENAILDAAWLRYADVGPDGTSVREVAGDAGCNHALIARYFRSKDGLVAAVVDRLDRRVDAVADSALASGRDPVVEVLASARADRPCVKLLIRSGLGDLGGAPFPASRHAMAILSPTRPGAPPRRRVALRSRLCAYAAASLVLGWLTYEDFVAVAVVGHDQELSRRDHGLTRPDRPCVLQTFVYWSWVTQWQGNRDRSRGGVAAVPPARSATTPSPVSSSGSSRYPTVWPPDCWPGSTRSPA